MENSNRFKSGTLRKENTAKRLSIIPLLGIALAWVLVPMNQVFGAQLKNVLLFHALRGFKHPSIPTINKAMIALGTQNGFTVDETNLSSAFTDANLAKYQVIIWNNNTEAGAIFNNDQKQAFFKYMKNGGGYVGLHGAGDTKGTWPEYADLVGGDLSVHSSITNGTLNLESNMTSHQAAGGLTKQITLREEWYSFKENPRPNVKVLYTIDEKTFKPGRAMGDHPMVWLREVPTGGRVFYTGIGHESNLFTNDFVLKHILNGIRWAANESTTRVSPTPQRKDPEFNVDGGKTLSVSVEDKGAHSIEILSLNGKRFVYKKGVGPASYSFSNIKKSGIYMVRIASGGSVSSKLVAM